MVNLSGFRKSFVLVLVISMVLVQPLSIRALTSSEAKQEWIQAKEASRLASQEHMSANIQWAANKTEANNQKVIDTGKAVLHAAFNEVEAWLTWVNLEVNENPDVPNEMKQTIQSDVNANLAKISTLRTEVDQVDNRLDLAIVFLKMVGKYLELVADVARNTGLMWVQVATTYTNTLEGYEEEMRTAAANLQNNSEIISKLDKTLEEIVKAKTNINLAEAEYQQVDLPGNPVLRFSSGNQYLRLARNNLLIAYSNLKQAYQLLMGLS